MVTGAIVLLHLARLENIHLVRFANVTLYLYSDIIAF